MWRFENRLQFEEIIDDLTRDEEVQALAALPQHRKNCTRLDHCIYVSYLSFLICRRLGLDYVAAARAGLLHDFHYGGEDAGIRRLWRHPHDALENACARYPLSEMERDIIVKHMWPLTKALPSYRESFVVSLADKICAMFEMSLLYRLFRVKKHLGPVAA